MAILDLKSNLSQWRKPTTVESGEKKKLSESPVKAVYSTSTDLTKQSDIKINKVDNSTSIQVPGAKKIDYKLFSINAKRNKGIPAISTLFGDTILKKVSEYKEQRVKEINKVSEFVKITPRGIQHISSVEVIKTILKEKVSKYKDQFPRSLPKVSEYVDQTPRALPKISEYIDQTPRVLPKISEYIDQIPRVLPKVSEYINQTPKSLAKISEYIQKLIDNKNSIYDTRNEIIKLLRYPYTLEIYANKRMPVSNAFDDLRSGAKGFIMNQKEGETAFLGISGNTYTYPLTVREGRLSDSTKIKGAQQWPLKVTFPNRLGNTKYTRTVYTSTKPYTSTTGITGDTLEKYFYRTNSPSARDIEYTAFNLRDSSFNTGLVLFNQPLILSGIQRPGAKLNIFDTWRFDDGFIRGGVVTSTQRAVVDVLRLGKWFASVKGLLFVARQAGLQASAPNTEADGNVATRAKNGALTLISALTNTATQHLGLRFRKDALPTDKTRTTYSSVMFGTSTDNGRGLAIVKQSIENNRLINLTDSLLNRGAQNINIPLISGIGGPQSVYGIGATNIRRVVSSNIANYSNTALQQYYTLGYNDIQKRITELSFSSNLITNFLLNNNNSTPKEPNAKWIATQGEFNSEATISDYQYTSQHQRPKLRVPDYGKRGKDLRNPLSKDIMGIYTPGNVGMIDPIWKINQTDQEAVDDFIKFMFHDLNTNERFRFRAYIENVSEDFSPQWQEVKILGRADSPYIYQGFERTLNVSFKVAALSRGDLMLMWDQLERLAKTTVPKYNSKFKMKGPLIKFTLGNWFINTPAFIRSLSYTVDNETPWEINLSNTGIYGNNADEFNVGELPMIVSVQISMQIFGEVRPETNHVQRQPAGITDSTHYNPSNLYPLGIAGLRASRQKTLLQNADVDEFETLQSQVQFTAPEMTGDPNAVPKDLTA